MSDTCPDADSYRVGWICALQIEYVAACELLDDEYRTPPLHSVDGSNIYTCGRIGDFKVVVACLPKGRYGLTSAITVAQDLRYSFRCIKFGLMVGIGGGAPSKKHDVRLGDVVVSTPTGRTGGVLHYEFGKTIQNKAFAPLGHLNAPPRFLLTAVQHLDCIHKRRGHSLDSTIEQMLLSNPRLRNVYLRPPESRDILYRPDYMHQVENSECDDCCIATASTTVSRPSRDDIPNKNSLIQIHYGLIASADRLMKDASVRDRLTVNEEVLCFEMEAAGLMDNFPCLAIRGISDYSDTHKNDMWQGYAAATAAAYAKELLLIIPGPGHPAQKISQPPSPPPYPARVNSDNAGGRPRRVSMRFTPLSLFELRRRTQDIADILHLVRSKDPYHEHGITSSIIALNDLGGALRELNGLLTAVNGLISGPFWADLDLLKDSLSFTLEDIWAILGGLTRITTATAYQQAWRDIDRYCMSMDRQETIHERLNRYTEFTFALCTVLRTDADNTSDVGFALFRQSPNRRHSDGNPWNKMDESYDDHRVADSHTRKQIHQDFDVAWEVAQRAFQTPTDETPSSTGLAGNSKEQNRKSASGT